MMKLKNNARSALPHVEAPSRRGFLNWLWGALGAAAFIEICWAAIAFLKPGTRATAAGNAGTRIQAGKVDQFQPDSVTAFPRGHFYLARLADGGFVALSRQCTHLGCTVPWDSEKRQFICPCHASVFDIQGHVIHSPASRPLDRFNLTIENQTVWVDTGKRIRQLAHQPTAVVYPPKNT